MKDSILRRGKSDNNVYISNNVALGNARLSIIDVKNGKQPMKKIINNKEKLLIILNKSKLFN